MGRRRFGKSSDVLTSPYRATWKENGTVHTARGRAGGARVGGYLGLLIHEIVASLEVA